MTKLEAILQEVGALSVVEQVRLIEFLVERSHGSCTAEDDVAAGQRGLMAWIALTCYENWAEFYPEGLANRSI